MPLLVTLPPKTDESGLGYYRRLADKNALYGWTEIAGLAGVAKERSGLFGQPEYIAKALGLEDQWTRFAKDQEAVGKSWTGLHRTAHDAVCAQCLQESPHIQLYWTHAYATACAHHRVNLIDRCEACGELLGYRRPHIELCACGHDLRKSASNQATPAQQWLASLLQTQGALSQGMAPNLKAVDLNRLASVIKALCLHAKPGSTPLRANAANPQTVAEAVEFLAPLEGLLQDWPLAFEEHIEAKLLAASPNARTLNKALGSWYFRLKKACDEPSSLDAFLEAVIRVASKKFDGVIGLDTAKCVVNEIHDHMLLAEAAKVLGVSRDRLLLGVKSRECFSRTRRFGTRGTVHEIPNAEVQRIQRMRSEWIDEAQACQWLGVTPAVLKNMRLAGVIDSDMQWRNDLYKSGAISQKSMTELHERLVRHTQHKRAHEPIVLWSELTSRRMGDNGAIQSVMQAALHGKIVPVVQGKKLGDLAFLRSDVAQYFGTPLVEAGTTIQRLSQETGWKWESIAHWIEEGFLEADSTKLRGQTCRVVSPQQLLKFRQSYLPLADLARAMNTKSSTISEKIPGLPIVGAKILPSGAHRGGLVRIADLATLAEAGAKVSRM